MRKNYSSEIRASGREFAKILRSLEQFFLTVGQNNFGNKIPLLKTLFIKRSAAKRTIFPISMQNMIK